MSMIMADAPIAYHGLAAYSGARGSAVAVYRNGIGAITADGEVCVADRPIGPVGLVLEGAISRAFDRDVWSTVDTDGSRRPTHRGWIYGIEKPTHQGWVEFSAETCRDAPGQYSRGMRYVEGFMGSPLLRGVWATPQASRLELAAARALARRYGIRVRIVTPTMRIFNDYPI